MFDGQPDPRSTGRIDPFYYLYSIILNQNLIIITLFVILHIIKDK